MVKICTNLKYIMNMLAIGGFDPSGGSGVQRDAQVARAMGFYPLSVVTAITAQNTSDFAGVAAVDADTLTAQLRSVRDDFRIHAIKIGMVWSRETIQTLARLLDDVDAPIVLDPVIESTTGGKLLADGAEQDLLRLLGPLARAITPNAYEAEHLAGVCIDDVESAVAAARRIQPNQDTAIIVTGVGGGEQISDVICHDGIQTIQNKRLDRESRGGGCAYSSALACAIASGHSVYGAAKMAHQMTYRAIQNAITAGDGLGVAADPEGDMLANAIESLIALPEMATLIPQCQTNFVFAPHEATRPEQVWGIQGRLVRTGKTVTRAGIILPGGSHHVASAVCSVREWFADIRAAANIRYSPDILAAMIREEFVVLFYDRADEPRYIKESGSSVAWGVREATKQAQTRPDAICHCGDVGKEPMTLVFGKTPSDVLDKIQRILK